MPIHTHFPAMKVAKEAEIRVGHALAREVVADVSNGDTPFFTEGYVARSVKSILKLSRVSAIDSGAADREIVR